MIRIMMELLISVSLSNIKSMGFKTINSKTDDSNFGLRFYFNELYALAICCKNSGHSLRPLHFMHQFKALTEHSKVATTSHMEYVS